MNVKKVRKGIFFLFIIGSVFILSGLQAQNQTSVIKKSFSFTIPSHGTKTYKINVPEKAKKIRAIISNQTQMVNLEIDGPTHTSLCHNSTWSNTKKWKNPLHCSASVGKTKLNSPGTWFIKVEEQRSGSSHGNKWTTGVLTIHIQ